MAKKKSTGIIVVPPGAFIDRHEKLAADYLAVVLKLDVTFLVPSRDPHVKTPDIEMSGLKWEIKSPKGKGSRVIENTLRDALRQSPNIILDLRRLDGRVPTYKHMREIERRFNDAKSLKCLTVITREEDHIDFKR